MNSPFAYGSTVSKKTFTNRKKEISTLFGNLTSMVNTIIISPRRWGKSSLVENVIEKIKKEKKNYRVVLIDLFSINTEEEFLELFAREVLKVSSTRLDDWVKVAKQVFKRLLPKLTVSLDPAEFSLAFDWSEIKKHRDEILNLPEVIAKQKKIKIVVCIDEFQNIRNYGKADALEQAIRSYWQRHKSTVYCLYGSKRHMMNEIFNDSSRPFYRFGDMILLKKIKEEDWVKFIVSRFKQTKKIILAEQASQIAQLMRNHPWYVQQLSHYIWLRTDKNVTQAIIDDALKEIKSSHLPFFQQRLTNISNTQVNLLKAIANQEPQLTSKKTMDKYHLGTPNNVRKNWRILNEKDIVDEQEEEYIFLDPVFELWFREKVL